MEINILYHTKETEKYKESSINYDWRELDVIPCYLHTFYAAHPIYNNGNEYTEILVGSNSIICILEYIEFIKLLNKTT